jgi:hypothetical protein
MDAIELARKRMFLAVVMSGCAAIAVVCGKLVWNGEQPRTTIILVGMVGALIAALSVHHVFALSPRFRATPEGVWFGGGWTIPWSKVQAVRIHEGFPEMGNVEPDVLHLDPVPSRLDDLQDASDHLAHGAVRDGTRRYTRGQDRRQRDQDRDPARGVARGQTEPA